MKAVRFLLKLSLGLFLTVILSCNNDDITSVTAIEVKHDPQPQVIFVGSTFEFQVRANNSTDVTNASIIKVDGVALEGTSFTTAEEPKTYQVQAFYKDFESDVITVATSEGFVKSVLIEDFTGTWCVNCPRVSYAIEELRALNENVVTVGVHVGNDPYFFEGADLLRMEFEVIGFPTALLNRTETWGFPEPSNIDQALNLIGFSSTGIAVTSSLEANTISATINVKYLSSVDFDSKLVIYLVENGLLHDQHNNTNYYGGESILVDFEHNHVLRALYTAIHGTNLLDADGNNASSGNVTEGSIFSYEFTETLPASIENSEHLYLVAFVVDGNGNVINVREAEIGETQDYQTGG